MENDIDQLKMRILYLEKELEKWRSDYLLLEEKLRRNPATRDTFAVKDPRRIRGGRYIG
jgi:hypothetical protein